MCRVRNDFKLIGRAAYCCGTLPACQCNCGTVLLACLHKQCPIVPSGIYSGNGNTAINTGEIGYPPPKVWNDSKLPVSSRRIKIKEKKVESLHFTWEQSLVG